MGLFDGLFGSSETTTEIPDWIKGPATEMLQRSVDMGKAGYMPWTGPSVAALNPAQIGAMRNNSAMAAAFGMDSTMPSIQKPQDFGGGIFGYSAMPLYDQNMAALQERAPGQMDYYNSFFVDPQTGVDGSRMQQSNLPTMMAQQAQTENSPMEQQRQDAWMQSHIDEVNGRNPVSTGGGIFGGYTGLGDMFNGGGPGASGDTYGGALGGVTNQLGGGIFGGLF